MTAMVPRKNALPRRRDATALARASNADARELLAFDVADETYALALEAVREILKPPPVTDVPRAPEHVLGVISVRGRITTVIDLARRLRRRPGVIDKNSRILLVDDGDEIIGLLVDRVHQVYRLSTDEVETASVVAGDTSEFVIGIGRPRASRHGRGDAAPSGATVDADILILIDHKELLRR